jgi:hypothetical protein
MIPGNSYRRNITFELPAKGSFWPTTAILALHVIGCYISQSRQTLKLMILLNVGSIKRAYSNRVRLRWIDVRRRQSERRLGFGVGCDGYF